MLAAGEGGGGCRSTVLLVEILARNSKIKIFLRPSAAITRGSLPICGRFVAEGHSIQCLSGPVRRGGRGVVHVLVMHVHVAKSPRLQVWFALWVIHCIAERVEYSVQALPRVVTRNLRGSALR